MPVSPSRDSTRLFVIGSLDQGAMFAYDPKVKRFMPFLGGMSAEMMEVSPDNQWIAYKTYPQAALWKCRVDGTQPVQLATLPFPSSIPRWSPDGKRIVFHAWLAKGPKLFVVPAEGGNVEEVVPGASNDVTNQMSGSWAADGESVAYGEYPSKERPQRVFTFGILQPTPSPSSQDRRGITGLRGHLMDDG